LNVFYICALLITDHCWTASLPRPVADSSRPSAGRPWRDWSPSRFAAHRRGLFSPSWSNPATLRCTCSQSVNQSRVTAVTREALLQQTDRATRYIYIHLYSHKLQFQKQEINKKEKETDNVSKNTTCQIIKCILTMHRGSAR